jgi:catechol 2,3-dioxygenase
MAARVTDAGGAHGLSPTSHGNAWSIYFKDPDGNGVEVFCDSPFHVRQPQARPWDLSMTEEELRRETEQQFGAEPEFMPMEAYYAEHRRRHED